MTIQTAAQIEEITTIAVDAMGGDHGPEVTVDAAIAFLKKNKLGDYRIILTGLSDQLNSEIEKHDAQSLTDAGHLVVRHTTELVGMDEPPAQALKKKKDSSMRVAINLVHENEAQACVSAGNTGALMATARFVLKMIKGIERPAICSTMPGKDPNKPPVHMLDLGANIDSSPEMLLQFAFMGSILASYVDDNPSPSVALLNVGAEEIKGSEKVKKAATLLAGSELNYIGYVEGDQIYSNHVDVIVCDGFEGNVALKASEGVAALITETMKEEFGRNIFTKLAGLCSLPVLNRFKERLDPRTHNGATLLGLNGTVIKSHGGTDAKGFEMAIKEAATQARKHVTQHISEEVSKILILDEKTTA